LTNSVSLGTEGTTDGIRSAVRRILIPKMHAVDSTERQQGGGGQMSSSPEEKQVLQIFDEIRRAMIANDPEPLRVRVADDYQGCDAGGRIHGRDSFLEAYGPGGVDLDEFEVREVEATSWTDTVLVRGGAEIRGRYGEHEFKHDLRFLDVYARKNAGWQLVASHVCDIVPE
jgi:hypothetical protein